MTNLIDIRAARIEMAYRSASPAERRLGRQWYPLAQEAARAIDPDDVERAAGVIAAFSPRERWHVNLAHAAAYIGWSDDDTQGLSDEPRVTFATQQRKAFKIAGGENPLDVLRGPKERAFYRAIMGDRDAVTVDTWAYRLSDALWAPHPTRHDQFAETPGITPRRYEDIAAAYRLAAKHLGVSARDLQATTWITVRGHAS